MYISRVELTDIRCLGKITLDLESDALTNKSLLLLGDNGVGKSTILRAIAIGLCDRAGAGGLLSDMYGDLIRKGALEGKIHIELKDGREKYQINTTIESSAADVEEVTKTTAPEERFPWNSVFVCGYGANRSMQGTSTYDEYSIADAVYTLFNYGWALQNPDVVISRRLLKAKDRKKEEKKICDRLAEILMLNAGSVKFTDVGLTVKADAGPAIHSGGLADGHESTITWILDLLGWTYLARPRSRLTEPRGIVLIDELEQHLHPRWQRYMLRLLTEHLPRVQFIATTHSPLCVPKTADSQTKRWVAELLVRDSQGNVRDETISPVEGRYDQVLASRAFGYTVSETPTVDDALNKASLLAAKGEGRSSREEEQYQELKAQIAKALVLQARSQVEREIEEQFLDFMRSKTAQLERAIQDQGKKPEQAHD